MEAGSTKGVWTETLSNGHKLAIDTNFNVIRVLNPFTGSAIKYEYDDGIRISDVVQVKKAHSKSLGQEG